MQPAGILSEGAFPSNWHGKKKGIEAGIIETFAEVTSGRDDDTFLCVGNCCEPRGDVAALLLALPNAVVAASTPVSCGNRAVIALS
jgi:hypothetical protein